MEYTGLYLKYPVNRALIHQEFEQQLKQKEGLEVEPAYQLGVIELNSSYIELVDKYFGWKGFMSGALLSCIFLFGFAGLALSLGRHWDAFWGIPPARPLSEFEWLNELALFLVFGVFVNCIFVWLLRRESFAHTHYPIRFNRRTRMVHAFRVNGTVLSVPWDDVFFCLGSLRQGNWEIQGHVLDQDGQTIKETFCAFPQIGGNQAEREKLKTHWEFVRRYMEDGPQDAHSQVKICLPIAAQRERVSFGFHRMHVEGTGNLMTQLLAAVMAIAILPGRWFAMGTSKIPQWPAEIEAANQVEAGDHYVRDACMNPKWREMPDWVWLLISAVVWGLIIFGASGLEPLR